MANVKCFERTVLRVSALLAECPECGHVKTEEMPTDACQWFYECEVCHTVLRPKAGDCCVFCSHGSVPCPPIQIGGQAECCKPTA